LSSLIDEIEPVRTTEDLPVAEKGRVGALEAVEANDTVGLAVAADRAVGMAFLVAASEIEARGLAPATPTECREETEPEGDMTEAWLSAIPGSATAALPLIEEARVVRGVMDGTDFIPAGASEVRRVGAAALVAVDRVIEAAGFDIVGVVDFFRGEVGVVPPGPEMLLDTPVTGYVWEKRHKVESIHESPASQ